MAWEGPPSGENYIFVFLVSPPKIEYNCIIYILYCLILFGSSRKTVQGLSLIENVHFAIGWKSRIGSLLEVVFGMI